MLQKIFSFIGSLCFSLGVTAFLAVITGAASGYIKIEEKPAIHKEATTSSSNVSCHEKNCDKKI